MHRTRTSRGFLHAAHLAIVGVALSVALLSVGLLSVSPLFARPLSMGTAAAQTSASTTATSALVGAYPDTVTVIGHGFGHGDGMSQWGAFGYAVDRNWDWTQILTHYYGGTARNAIDPLSEMTVELSALNDAAATSVVHRAVAMATNADTTNSRFSAIVAVEQAPNTYRVYGRADVATCAVQPIVADLDKPLSGWRLLNAAFVSTSTTTRLSITVPERADRMATTTDPADLIGVCQTDGSVRSYRGSIQVMNGTAAENRTVNAVPLDAYLRGVVPSESIPSWGDAGGGKGANALRAQAVAARTYALASRRGTFAQTCDTQQCQVYSGMASRSRLTGADTVLEDPRTDAAIVATAGVILRTAAGAPAFAQFSSSSGGYTSGVNFAAVEDLGDSVSANTNHNWTTTITRSAIERNFPVGTLQGIDVLTRNGLGDFGGRIKTMRLRGTTGTVTVTGEQFRTALTLRSAWFSLPTGCEGSPVVASRGAVASRFHTVAPTRIIDTRSGLGALRATGACTLVVPIGGRSGVPASARSVTLNVTVIGSVSPGYATVFPCDQGRPASSNVNIRPELAVANLVSVALDGAGDVCVFLDTVGDLIVDVLGWEGPGSGSTLELRPAERIADTRQTGARTRANEILTVSVPAILRPTSQPGTMMLNVTATGSLNNGFVTVYACDSALPATSNLNLVAGRDVANQVVTTVSASSAICLFTSAATHLVVDVIGTFTDVAGRGVQLAVAAPSRIFDSRQSTAVGPGAVTRVSIPGDAPAAMVNLTGTGTTSAGFVTAYSCDTARPPTSNLNLTEDVDVANVAVVGLGASRQVCIVSSSTTHLIVDLLATLRAS
jgi:SpoIID/LytB domain protein